MLYALLLPAVRVARVLRVPLEQLVDLVEMAYFHDVRSTGARMQEIAELLGVSMRKAAQLSRRLKHNFLDVEQEVSLPRRIEFLLWAEPLSAARVAQTLSSESPDAVDAALAQLQAEGRVRPVQRGRTTVYERTRENSRLVAPSLQSKLDGLSNLLGNVAAAAYARIFHDEQKALLRTISFYVRPEDLHELRALYEHVWKEIQRLEGAAKQDRYALRMDLSMLYAPFDYLDKGESYVQLG